MVTILISCTEPIWRERTTVIRPYQASNEWMNYALLYTEGEEVVTEWKYTKLYKRTLMTKALRKAAGSLSLYLFVTSTPPTTVAALLAKVN